LPVKIMAMYRLLPSFLLLLVAALQPTPAVASDDADRARDAVESGRYVPLEEILRDALARYPGQVVGVELDDDEYEIEILREGGDKVELEFDARTGELEDVDTDD
jgi:uncharacterized membrane protein YkoI